MYNIGDNSKSPTILRSKKYKIASRLRELYQGHTEEPQTTFMLKELEAYQLELEAQNQKLQQMREALEESRDLYANLYDSSPQGYLTFNKNGIITEINLSATNLLGKERSALLSNSSVISFVKKSDQNLFSQHLNKCLTSDVGLKIKTELSLIGHDGIEIPVQMISVGCIDPQKANLCFRTTIVDLTEFKKIEKDRKELIQKEIEARSEAERANLAKDNFLAVVSHELRAPLQPILGWLQLIRSGDVKPENMAKALDVIERNARAQVQIINDLLDVSRVISGKLHVELRPLRIKPILEAVVESIRPQAEAKDLKIEISIDKKLEPIMGDPIRIQQIIWNLLSNSIKFTPKNGMINVQLKTLDNLIELVVSDTGKGINANFLPYIFERFRQEDNSRTRKMGGLGLGLAIVHHLVTQHQGKIIAESEGENKGTTIRVFFPVALINSSIKIPQQENSDLKKISNYHKILKDLRVLVLDDDIETQENIAAILQATSAQVLVASSVEEARRIINLQAPDVIISDIGMAGEDGYSLIKWIRQNESQFDHRILASTLSAYVSPEDKIRALDSGFDLHLTKPINPAELIRSISKLAGRG